MKIKPNFLSIVVLGSFNPSILSAGFLSKECKVSLPSNVEEKHIPIFSSVSYNNIVFQATYDNFQALQRSLEDFDNPSILEPIINYFKVLKYTPLTACGLNFNIDISDINIIDFEEFIINQEMKLLDIIDKDEIMFNRNIRLIRGKKEKYLNELNISYQIDTFTNESLSIQKHEEQLTLNFNHEVRNLDGHIECLFKMLEDYHVIKDIFIALIPNLFQYSK